MLPAELRRFGVVSGVLASLACLAAGLWLLTSAGFNHEDPLPTALGFYFIGKALFVGPLLIVTSLRGGG